MIKKNNFPYFFIKKTTTKHQNHIVETVLMRGYNIFSLRNKKNISVLPVTPFYLELCLYLVMSYCSSLKIS